MGKTHLSIEAGPPLVDASPMCQQRPLHLLSYRDHLHALRHVRLRLGGSVERATGSTGFFTNNKSITTHHMEVIKGRATRGHFVPPATA
jgi:hypothetical protein